MQQEPQHVPNITYLIAECMRMAETRQSVDYYTTYTKQLAYLAQWHVSKEHAPSLPATCLGNYPHHEAHSIETK